ncbi:MAG TPA: error-prone DNA polymerase, partial [Steroidobacteraceae bacterium]|nr:error-prone DNA polymerase [Steroidobacteraceae bacterium]
VALAQTRLGYGRLSQLITKARRAAEKGSYLLQREDLTMLDQNVLLWIPGLSPSEADALWLRERFEQRLWLGVHLHRTGQDQERLQQLLGLAMRFKIPATACAGALMHSAERKSLQDVVTAIRLKTPVNECGYALQPNAERRLRTIAELKGLYPPRLLRESAHIAEQCCFSLDELRYEYPRELVPEGETSASWLLKLTERGAKERWPKGLTPETRALLEHELALIAELRYEPYFLTVYDLVREARARGILCQGRGSAANSAVCFALGVTAVDPSRQQVLFERFISKERAEPPDIDVDFEHERREEIIQYIYNKYGRHRAGLAATVIRYCRRSALRDVGKAHGLDKLQLDRLVFALDRREAGTHEELQQWLRDAGFDPNSPVIIQTLLHVAQIAGFPRHLSQHVGGFVIAAVLLEDLVPVENASMVDRTVIQWDKDDLESLGLLKVDVLALGIMSAMRKALDYHNAWHDTALTLATIPAEDPATYAMIQRADTIGVFQIESRAQMSMLPRLKPKCFYDLVIEVAIVRPGPIQGDMVHPYLQRREGLEEVDYPSESVRSVLERTMGVPIFQEQVMQLAVVAAGFTPGEADQLRRAMAGWRKDKAGLDVHRTKLLAGLRERGYPDQFADRLFRQIEGFGEYGFPESHAASFALLAYASAWLKCHAPAEFTAGIINSQPMGFYAPAQLVRDAREHGVEVRGVDITRSDWDCTLEPDQLHRPALRLGLRLIAGLPEVSGRRIAEARRERVFTDAQDLAIRAQLNKKELEALAGANALQALTGNRHQAAWSLAGIDIDLPLFRETPIQEATPMLHVPTEAQNIAADYSSVGLTLRRHPLALLRGRFLKRQTKTAADLKQTPTDTQVRVAGLVLMRQAPGTANNTTFITIEDETGIVNLIVWSSVSMRYRNPFLQAHLLEVGGKLQHERGVTHVIAEDLVDRTSWLGSMRASVRNFR